MVDEAVQSDPLRAVGEAAVGSIQQAFAASYKRTARRGKSRRARGLAPALEDSQLSTKGGKTASQMLLAAVSGAKLSDQQLLSLAGRNHHGGRRQLKAARGRKLAGDVWAAVKKVRADSWSTNPRVKALVAKLWEDLSVKSPMAKHADRLPPSQRMSRKAALQAAKAGRLQLRKKPKKERPAPCDDPRRQSIRFTPFGAEYVTRKLHADVKLLAELEQLGVKPRGNNQEHPMSARVVNALKPWYVQPLDPKEMDLCVCPYHTEIKHLWEAIVADAKAHHGPDSDCSCQCSACHPPGSDSEKCQLAPLGGSDVFAWLKDEYLCPRTERTMAVLPGGDRITAEFADYKCIAGECSECNVEPLRCAAEKSSGSRVVPVVAYELHDGVWRLDHRKWPIRKVWNRFLACLRGEGVGPAGDTDTADAVRTARRPYQAANGFAYHHFEAKWVNVVRPIVPQFLCAPCAPTDASDVSDARAVVEQEYMMACFTAAIEQDYMLASELPPPTKEQSQGEFRKPFTIKGCTGNCVRRSADGTLVYEEVSTLCGDKDVKQNAGLTEASRRQIEADAEARKCIFWPPSITSPTLSA
jgi:hypothetical protein